MPAGEYLKHSSVLAPGGEVRIFLTEPPNCLILGNVDDAIDAYDVTNLKQVKRLISEIPASTGTTYTAGRSIDGSALASGQIKVDLSGHQQEMVSIQGDNVLILTSNNLVLNIASTAYINIDTANISIPNLGLSSISANYSANNLNILGGNGSSIVFTGDCRVSGDTLRLEAAQFLKLKAPDIDTRTINSVYNEISGLTEETGVIIKSNYTKYTVQSISNYNSTTGLSSLLELTPITFRFNGDRVGTIVNNPVGEGEWRTIVISNNLVTQRFESSVWVTKSTILSVSG